MFLCALYLNCLFEVLASAPPYWLRIEHRGSPASNADQTLQHGLSPLSPLAPPSNNRAAPVLGIDEPQPRFSWFNASEIGARGQMQAAYQIRVSRRPNLTVVWDSGRVNSLRARSSITLFAKARAILCSLLIAISGKFGLGLVLQVLPLSRIGQYLSVSTWPRFQLHGSSRNGSAAAISYALNSTCRTHHSQQLSLSQAWEWRAPI